MIKGGKEESIMGKEEIYAYLKAILHLTPGTVTPLGLLNDGERRVHLYVDADFKDNLIGVHPNDNTATVWLSADDLLALIQEHGNEAEFVDI